MKNRNPKLDAYFDKAKEWCEESKKLRTIVLACDELTEEVKWRQPCYTVQGSNIVIIGKFKNYCALTFFKGALLKDPKGILAKIGENTQSGRVIRFTSVQEIAKLEPAVKALIREAINVEKAGLKVELKKTAEYAVPEELQRKLEAKPALKKAFAALTPGRQRAYLLYFSAAKQSATREGRVEKCMNQILAAKQRKILTLVAVLCTGIVFIPGRDEIGKNKQLTVNANKAVALAEKYMAEDGLDHKDFMTAEQLYLLPDSTQDTNLDWQYAFDKLGYKKTKAIYDQLEPGLVWMVRFFRPEESKSYRVYEWPDGRKRYCSLVDINEAPGANLDENVAESQVETYLKKYRPELSPFSIDTKSKTAQLKRLDYKFDFLVPQYNIGDTPAKLHVDTKGDKISSIDVDWDVPDDWTWPRKTLQWYQQVSRVLRIIGLAVAAAAGLVWGVKVMRSIHISWRAALTAGVIWSAVLAAGILNSSVKSLITYDTAESFQSFLGQTVASRSITVLLESLGCLILSVMGFASLRKYFPAVRQQLHSWILLWPANDEQKQVRSNLWVDAAISSYALCAAAVALQSLETMILSYFSPAVPLDIPTHLASILSTTMPAIDILSNVLHWSIFIPMALALFASLWQQYLSSKARTNSILLACAILWGIDSWYWQNCLVNTIFLWYKLYLLFYFARKVFAGNALAYVFATAEIASVLCLSELLSHAAKISGLGIAMLIGIMALPAMLAVIFWRMDRSSREKTSG